MTGMEWVAVILTGGLLIPAGVFLLARTLVHRHGNPADGHAYLEWFRAQKAAERAEAVRAEIARQRSRDKELTYR